MNASLLPDIELTWHALNAMKALGGSATRPELIAKTETLAGITDAQRAILLGNGQPRILYQHWTARDNLLNVEAIERRRRGFYVLTDKGRNFDRTTLEAALETSKREARKNRGKRRVASVTEDAQQEQEERLWKDQLLQELLSISPQHFENLAQRLLREAGFTNVQVLGRSGDGGIDGTGMYQVSLLSFPVFFQCKRWKQAVGAKEIRDFRGAMMGRGDNGLFITTTSFTRDAITEASRDGAMPIDLIDGQQLCDLLEKYELGVRKATVVDSDWFKSELGT